MEEKVLLNKKLIALSIILVSLLAVSAVSAAENVTDDYVADSEIDGSVSLDTLKKEDMHNFTAGDDFLAAGENSDVLSTDSPSYDEYSLTVYDTVISQGSFGAVNVYIDPFDNDDGDCYAYDFYFNVYDSNGNQKISENLYSSTKTTGGTYTISPNTLSAGTYTIELVNCADGYLMDSAKLTVKPKATKITTKVTVKNIRGYENKKVKLTAIVKDKSGKKVKKGTVIFKFKGKRYKIKVKNGKAVKSIRIPKTNNRGITYKYATGKVTEIYDDVSYTGKVSFLADKLYKASSSKFKVTSMKKSKTKKDSSIKIHKKTAKKKTSKKSTALKFKIGKYIGKISKKDYNNLKKAKKYGYQYVISFKCLNYKNYYMSIDYFPYSKNDPGNVYHLNKGFYGNVWCVNPFTGNNAVKDKYMGRNI